MIDTSSSAEHLSFQSTGVAQMRATLLSFNKNDPDSAKKALQYITAQRVYHQMSRIIRYTEMLDKIEDKMYESIELDLDQMDTADPQTWRTLLQLQSKLQEAMIESHKLLEPYLKMETLTTIEVPKDDPNDTFTAMILDQQSREKLRTSAQEVLAAIAVVDTSETTPVSGVKNSAKEALKHISEADTEIVTQEKT